MSYDDREKVRREVRDAVVRHVHERGPIEWADAEIEESAVRAGIPVSVGLALPYQEFHDETEYIVAQCGRDGRDRATLLGCVTRSA